MIGSVDVTKLLLENGADVNAVREEKSTPLHLTAEYGHVDVMKVLIHARADVTAQDVKVGSAVCYALIMDCPLHTPTTVFWC